MSIRYLLFDLDGTLTDPAEGITNCVRYALDKFGIYPSSQEELYPYIGPPLVYSFRQFHGLSAVEADQAVTYYRQRFAVDGWRENRVFEGVSELLNELKTRGVTLMVATSKPEEMSIEILTKFGLAPYFDKICGATLDRSRVNKEDVIDYLLRQINTADPLIMVGDTAFDVLGASLHHIPTIGVSWGYGDAQEMLDAGAVAIAHSTDELLTLINQ